MAGDSYYNQRALGLHFNGANNSTVITDNSPTPKTPSVVGNAKISSAQSKFGGSSLLLDGTGDYVSVANHAGLALTNQDFSCSFFVYFNAVPAAGDYVALVSKRTTASTNNSFTFWYGGTEKWYFAYGTTGTNQINKTGITTHTPASNTWYHVAFVRNDTNFDVFIDGVKQTTVSIGADTIFTSTAPLQIGAASTTSPTFFLNGYIDELKLVIGAAEYTSDFTPPTAQFDDFFNFGVPNIVSITLAGGSPVSISGQYGVASSAAQLILNGQMPNSLSGFYGTATESATINFNGLLPVRVIPSVIAGESIGSTSVASGKLDEYKGFETEAYGSASIATAWTGWFANAYGSTSTADGDIAAEYGFFGESYGSTAEVSGALLLIGQFIGGSYGSSSKANGYGGWYAESYGSTSKATAALTENNNFKASSLIGSVSNNSGSLAFIAGFSGNSYGSVSIAGFDGFQAFAVSSVSIADGIFFPVVDGIVDYAIHDQALVMNTHTAEVSRYTNYNFMGLIALDGKPYGVRHDGIYRLSEDHGETALSGRVVTKDTDFGSFQTKRVPYCYLNNDTKVRITPFVDAVEKLPHESQFAGRKVHLARGPSGRYWQFQIDAIKQLEGVEFTPQLAERKRRVK